MRSTDGAPVVGICAGWYNQRMSQTKASETTRCVVCKATTIRMRKGQVTCASRRCQALRQLQMKQAGRDRARLNRVRECEFCCEIYTAKSEKQRSCGKNSCRKALARSRYVRKTIKITCLVCKKVVDAIRKDQFLCEPRGDCYNKRRSDLRKQRLRDDRKKYPLLCEYCERPITVLRIRRYHPECKAIKNAERVAVYHATHVPKMGPKKSRKYKGTVKCKCCGERVTKTGSGQITCRDRVCIQARKNERKRQLRAQRQCLEQLREKKLQKSQKPSRKKTAYSPHIYSVAM
jgi:hypothetical protein